ncbi:hypothetical protein EAL2_808p03480 (plasmid) [Peptoclostridium acidaminophilum DSM 3953]|uniref:Uncharacterized protein n=1 Tax=Peptoclostridium acidaminophilum DSM 3953 TaxID=1286171 RepID=W8TNX0_PEPAC|nr:hypothetical protein EAL2_808p03480 [Peptoclostridium acidaminophilum DSM 3953]
MLIYEYYNISDNLLSIILCYDPILAYAVFMDESAFLW